MFDDLFPVTGKPDVTDPDGSRWRFLGLLLAGPPTAYAIGSAFTALVAALVAIDVSDGIAMALVAVITLTVAALHTLLTAIARILRPGLVLLHEAVWLLVLPTWGFLLDVSLTSCDACAIASRPLAWPEGLFVLAAYVVGLSAYGASRWHPKPLHPGADAVLIAALAVGVLTCLLLGLQFGGQIATGVIFGFIGLPLLAPVVVAPLFALAAARRVAGHPRWIAVGAGAAGLFVGGGIADLLVQRLGLGTWDPFGGALTKTCGWTLSLLEPVPQDCHYLCTVAARGHPWLVRPLRMGRRRGRPIVVNRQLAVANAFEDWLVERWPRFGRGCRRLYDRLGWPISRYIRTPAAADLVFLGMLPAQAGFEVVLWGLDRDKEARIDRMYR